MLIGFILAYFYGPTKFLGIPFVADRDYLGIPVGTAMVIIGTLWIWALSYFVSRFITSGV
jgi:hypothetical protein